MKKRQNVNLPSLILIIGINTYEWEEIIRYPAISAS